MDLKNSQQTKDTVNPLTHLQQLSLDDLMKKGCDWVGDYLKYSGEVDESDRSICF